MGDADATLDRYMKNPFSIEEEIGEVESVRDIRKGVMERDAPRSVASDPVLPDLMYPENSISSLAQPGGFRRHAMMTAKHEGTTRRSSVVWSKYTAFIDLLPQFPLIERERQDGAKLTNANRTGPVKAFFTLFKSFCGGGLIYYPRMFSMAGFLPAFIITCFVSLWSAFSAMIMLKTKSVMEKRGHTINSYEDLATATMGKKGLMMCNTTVLGSQIGFACIYFLYISNYVRMLVRQLTDCDISPEMWELCTIALPILYLLVLVRHLKYYALPAVIGFCCIVVVVVYLVIYDVIQLDGVGAGNWESFNTWPGTLVMFGSTCYSFEGTVMVIPVQQSMKDTSKFPLIFLSVMVIYTSFLLGLGSIHYVVNGSNTGTLAIENVPMKSVSAKVLTGLYIFVTVTSFPIFLYPVTRTIDRWCGYRTTQSGHKWAKNAIRLGLVLFAYVVAVTCSGFLDSVTSIIGASFCIPIALLFPPLMAIFVKQGWTPADEQKQVAAAAATRGEGGGIEDDGDGGADEEGLMEPLLLLHCETASGATTEEAAAAIAGEVHHGHEEAVDIRKGEEGGETVRPGLNVDLGTLYVMVGLAGVAATLGTVMAVYSILHPDQDPITQDEYCGVNTTSIAAFNNA